MTVPHNSGFCHCCRAQTEFQIFGDWLRDYYVCTLCFSIPRQRHLQHILDHRFPGWEDMAIHESSPSNDLIARYCKDYSSSQFLPGVPPGETVNGIRCEDLERLTFADETFDLFITQDVLEHVFDPQRAYREILRVLKPGGVHVFTTPKHRGFPHSRPRARREGEQIVHLETASYHGNPVGDGRALVTWDYGEDFENLVTEWSGTPVITYVTRDRSLGLDGEYLEVFVMRRAT